MQRRRSLSFSLAALLLCPALTQAALVTSLTSVNINGSFYDVTFHTATSFQALWDADGDFSLGDSDGSLFNSAPTFWGDLSGAQAATEAVIAALGTTDWTTVSGSNHYDRFNVPIHFGGGGNAGKVYTFRDRYFAPGTDTLGGEWIFPDNDSYTFASFTSSSAVPLPAGVWLLGSGLIGLIGVGRRYGIPFSPQTDRTIN